MHNYLNNVFTIEKGDRKHSLIPFQNEEVGRSNLSINSRVVLADSERVCNQYGQKTYGTLRMEVKN